MKMISRLWNDYKKQFLILLGIYLLAFSAIIRANYSYVDDMGRTYAGYHGWLDWSRWTTEILATFVHAEWYLTDISPLPQILACMIMAAGGIILADIFKKEQKVGFLNIVAVALTALSPYFLGIVSYKFDSPYMALSFLVSIIPFLFRRDSKRLYVIASVICLLIMCTTYQASSGIYPLIVLFLTAQDVISGRKIKECLEFIGISVLCYLVSLGVFWLLLMRENGVSIGGGSSFIPYAVDRYITYYKIIFQDLTIIWLTLMLVLLMLFVYAVFRKAVIHRMLALFMGIFTVITGSFLCFGVYLFISEDAYDTRAMYGFNVFLTLLALFVSFYISHWMPKMVYAALAWSFLIFSLTYGNALSQQQSYLNYRIGLLADDLNELEIMKTDEIKKIRIEGDVGVSPVIMNMSEAYPIFKKIIFTGLGEEFWGGYYFYHYFNIPDIELTYDKNECNDLPIIKDTMYHTIRGNSHNILIELH